MARGLAIRVGIATPAELRRMAKGERRRRTAQRMFHSQCHGGHEPSPVDLSRSRFWASFTIAPCSSTH